MNALGWTGWIVAAVLWVIAGPFVFKAVRDPRGGDEDVAWLCYVLWPFVVLLAWGFGIWQRVFR